jgi:hypothetical protein
LPRTVLFQAAVVLMLWCALRALMADAWATLLQRVAGDDYAESAAPPPITADRKFGFDAVDEPAVLSHHKRAG